MSDYFHKVHNFRNNHMWHFREWNFWIKTHRCTALYYWVARHRGGKFKFFLLLFQNWGVNFWVFGVFAQISHGLETIPIRLARACLPSRRTFIIIFGIGVVIVRRWTDVAEANAEAARSVGCIAPQIMKVKVNESASLYNTHTHLHT